MLLPAWPAPPTAGSGMTGPDIPLERMNEEATSHSTAGRIARNTIANWVGVAVNALILILLTPYVVSVLGDERFGIYAIATQTLVYVNLLTLGLRGSVVRFASRDIAAKAPESLNRTLSAAAAMYVVLGITGAIACGALGLVVPGFFDMDPGTTQEVHWLFAAMGAHFFLSLFGLTYNAVLVGYQRYELLNLGNILRDVSKAVLIVGVFTLGWRSLGGVGLSLAGAEVLALAYFFWAATRLQRGLRIRPGVGTGSAARKLLSFGLWNALVQIGNVITFATPIFVVGRTLGMDQVVFYAVPFMLVNRLRIGVVGLASTFAPVAAATLASGDRAMFRELLVGGTRAAAALCFPLGAVLLILCRPFLGIWMGEEYAWSWVVLGVLMISMFGRISQAPTLHILIGGGRIRGLAYIQMASAVATLALTILFATKTNWGVVGVAAGVTIPLFISHSVLLPCYAARQAEMNPMTYLRRAYLGPLVSTVPAVGVSMAMAAAWPIDGWMPLIVTACVALGASAVPVWYTCLDASLRAKVLAKIGVV